MKAFVEVIALNINDVITASAQGCTPPDMGDDEG